MHINAAVALARDRARDIVTNSERAIAFAFALAQCAQRVRRFAALADRENERAFGWRCIAMTVLARKIDIHGNVRELLDRIFADARGVERSPATGQDDARNLAPFCRTHVQAAEFRGAIFKMNSAAHRVPYG